MKTLLLASLLLFPSRMIGQAPAPVVESPLPPLPQLSKELLFGLLGEKDAQIAMQAEYIRQLEKKIGEMLLEQEKAKEKSKP